MSSSVGATRAEPDRARGAGARSLLVNYWCANPVGHAVEGLRYCLGYHRADPELRISLLLNGATATELASFCPFIERTFAVGYGFYADERDPAGLLAAVPHDWDFVVDDPRGRFEPELESFSSLRRYYEASSAHFRPRVAHGAAGKAPPPYEAHHSLRLELPQRARAQARRALAAAPLRIALMPAGSGRRADYPSAVSWVAIVRALLAVYPEAHFCLVGKLARDGRTSTRITEPELARIAGAVPSVSNHFDRLLADQLAAVEQCRLFISPHTGFGMAALAVGTPWLTVSGGPWAEYFFNGIPFYSVLPDPSRYPCFTADEPLPTIEQDEDGEGERALSMSRARIADDLPELVEAARLLIEGRLTYEEALARHFPCLLAAYGGDRSRVWAFDGLHESYV